jgi:PncC family amidohydrolase
MASFLTDDQRALVAEMAAILVERRETVAVAESTTGGLISAALLSYPGASRYYAGGAVLYTLRSRTDLAGVPAEEYANYRGTTAQMLVNLAEGIRAKLGATWCIAESGLAGPTGSRFGAPAGQTTLGVAGPIARAEVFQTGSDDREGNMATFTTLALRYLRNALSGAGPA